MNMAWAQSYELISQEQAQSLLLQQTEKVKTDMSALLSFLGKLPPIEVNFRSQDPKDECETPVHEGGFAPNRKYFYSEDPNNVDQWILTGKPLANDVPLGTLYYCDKGWKGPLESVTHMIAHEIAHAFLKSAVFTDKALTSFPSIKIKSDEEPDQEFIGSITLILPPERSDRLYYNFLSALDEYWADLVPTVMYDKTDLYKREVNGKNYRVFEGEIGPDFVELPGDNDPFGFSDNIGSDSHTCINSSRIPAYELYQCYRKSDKPKTMFLKDHLDLIQEYIRQKKQILTNPTEEQVDKFVHDLRTASCAEMNEEFTVLLEREKEKYCK